MTALTSRLSCTIHVDFHAVIEWIMEQDFSMSEQEQVDKEAESSGPPERGWHGAVLEIQSVRGTGGLGLDVGPVYESYSRSGEGVVKRV